MPLTIDITDEAAARAQYEWSIPGDPYPASVPAPQCGQCTRFFASRHKAGTGCCCITEQTRRPSDSAVNCHWYEEDCPF